MQAAALKYTQIRYTGVRSQLYTQYANQIFRRYLYTISKLETDAIETDNGDSIL
jgi:hypothetical protein